MNRIPEGWKMMQLGNVGDIKFSNVDKKTHEGQASVYLCNYMDVYKNEYIHSKMKFMGASASIQEINNFKLNKFDVLFTKDSETPDDIANSSVVIEELDNVICGYHLAIVRPNDQIAYGPFLSKQIKSNYVRHQFIIDAKGSTRFGLGLNSISKINIPLPPLPEQKKIAEILSSVDRSIEATEKMIAKLADLKKALMQELFTKGIGHTKFKDSPIGRIPEDWEVVNLKTIANVSYGLGQPPKFVTDGVPFIRATDIHEGLISNDKILLINPRDIPKGRDIKIKEGDIIVVRSGAYTGDIGYATCEWEMKNSVCGYDLRVRAFSCNPKFLCHWLLSEITQKSHFELERSRSAQPHLNSEQVENTPVALPKTKEQNEISYILSANDAKIEKAKSRLKKLKDMKKGLMQDLLTGNIRIKTR